MPSRFFAFLWIFWLFWLQFRRSLYFRQNNGAWSGDVGVVFKGCYIFDARVFWL